MLSLTLQNNVINVKGKRFGCKLVFVLLTFLFSITVSSQNQNIDLDSIVEKIMTDEESSQITLKNKADVEKKIRQKKYLNYQNIQRQNKIFNLLELEILNAKSLLNKDFHYKNITSEIEQLNIWKEYVTQGLVKRKSNVLTDRNLSSTSILLDELLKRTNNRIEKISKEYNEFNETVEKIDSLVANKHLYYVPTDSVSRKNYHLQSEKLLTEINVISERLKNSIDSIQLLKINANRLKYKIENDRIENEKIIKAQSEQLFTKKIPVFGDLKFDKKVLKEYLEYSIKTNKLVLYFYLVNNFNAILFMLLLIIATVVYFIIKRKKIIDIGYKKESLIHINILNSPICSALLIVPNLFLIILPMPPIIFSTSIWTFSTIVLTLMLWHSIGKFVWKIWIPLFLLCLFTFLDVLLLIQFVEETYFILAINCFGIAIGVYSLLNRNQFKHKIYLWSIVIGAIIQLFSLYFLVNGNYNLGKFLMTKSVALIIVFFILNQTLIILKEIILINKLLENFDLDKNKKTIKEIPQEFSYSINTILFIVVVLMMIRNTYFFQSTIQPIKNFIIEQRSIGSINFSFENILTFIFIIIIASFISKTIYFLASNNLFGNNNKTKKYGSWLFLSRITIVTLGVLIAFSSIGIPLDKITLIISALGVGIGFGMQNFVNNLISGLIIAFEKPIRLDDVIELGTQSGKMKSIGIRSSVITTYDGADVVIPNGELLNQNLTNWTLGTSHRRSEIRLGVAYGTDLELTKKILFEILENNKDVLMRPLPIIWFTQFGDNSIDLVLKYWIKHFDYDYNIKSDLIIEIDKLFKENNIVIPFSQHDLHIKNDDISNEPKE